jgi:hypothetical protein
MSDKVILWGGSYSQVVKYVGTNRELVVDDSNKELRLLDGATPGGTVFQSKDSAQRAFQPKATELTSLSALQAGDQGLLVRVGAGQYKFRGLKAGSAALVIQNPAGLAGDITIDLAADIPGTHRFLEDTTFAKKAIAVEFVGPLTGDSTGTHTGGLDARGKTVQFDNGQIPSESVKDLNKVIDEIQDALNSLILPTGMIMMWAGNIADIPSGWALCDGSQGTPNLTDRFVLSATTQDKIHVAGGYTSHMHVATIDQAGDHSHGITVGDTALTIQQIPSHSHGNGVTNDVTNTFNHGAIGANPNTSANINENADRPGVYEGNTTNVGGGQTHTHTGSSANAGSHVHGVEMQAGGNIPPYYSLAYVMKLAQ